MEITIENLRNEWASIRGNLSAKLAKEYDDDLIKGFDYYNTEPVCKKTIDLFVELCNVELAKGGSGSNNSNKLGLVKARARAGKAKLALLAI